MTAMAWDIDLAPGKCLASGMCAAVAPHAFKLDGPHAEPLTDQVAEGDEDVVYAADSCPAAAITVTAGHETIAPLP